MSGPAYFSFPYSLEQRFLDSSPLLSTSMVARCEMCEVVSERMCSSFMTRSLDYPLDDFYPAVIDSCFGYLHMFEGACCRSSNIAQRHDLSAHSLVSDCITTPATNSSPSRPHTALQGIICAFNCCTRFALDVYMVIIGACS